AYAAAVLVRPDTGETLGISFDPAPSDIPIPFSIAFDPAAIDPESDYVVKAAVVAGDQRWENAAGVPVITKGNQLTGVTITVSEVVEPTPTPAPEPTATPAPSPVPEPDEDGLGTTGLLVLLAAAVAAIVGVGAFLVGRRSGGAGPGPDGGETPGETGPGTGPDGEPPVGDAVTEDVPTGEDPTGDAASAPAAALEEDVPAAATPAPGTEEVPDQARE
ncbi:MAG: YbaY family lipoprotein, partial [Chloroflexi bacterium]|nr:YbaY family lipoprotein [Chloroflexota bacterium]